MSVSIFNYDNTLPGVITEIDSHLASEYDTSLFGTTDSVVVIGTAFDGPTAQVTPVYSVEHAAYVFGKTYDSKTRREASLVTGIQDAWNKGCRTIYAMRINGVEMFKDFELCVNCDFKLRVKSRYPSNLGKQVYVKYDDTIGAETFTIYKPASRATIKEKMAGLVEDENAVMVNQIRVAQDYAFTKDSKLVDVLEIVNNHGYNNVVELEIVDLDGNVVTNSTEAYEVTLGHIFPGVYFIGREGSAIDRKTDVAIKVVTSEDDAAPYSNFDKKYYSVLNVNTDVNAKYPIHYSSVQEMRELLMACEITMDEADDYLEVAELSNRAFPENGIDYEESTMTAFEKYMRLGSGFAITAVAERRVDAEGNEMIPKIKEAAFKDINRVVPTGDGIYSILEDTKIRYHVLAHDICADTLISGKLPKPNDFKITMANEVALCHGLVNATAKVSKDNEFAPQSYKFQIWNNKEVPEIKKEEIFMNAFETVGYKWLKADIEAIKNAVPGSLAFAIKERELLVANDKGVFVPAEASKYDGKLFFYSIKPIKAVAVDGVLTFVEITADNFASEIGDYKYILVKEGSEVFVAKVGDYTKEVPFLADMNTALTEEKDELFVFYTNCVGENQAFVSYPNFDSLSLSEFVEKLNNSKLSSLFSFELTQKGELVKDEYVMDAYIAAAAEEGKALKSLDFSELIANEDWVIMAADRVRGYDYSKHIPYYTSDNFARHLAQHATYTELKTYPTHGVIGIERINDVSKTNLAKKVNDLKEFNWNMYVKNNYGRNMLDADNMPYHIGRNVTVTAFQDIIVTPSNYTAIVNGATGYAGMVSSTDIGQSTTGQTIDVKPMYEFSRSQLQTLSDLGVVTVKNSFTKGYVVTDGITMGATDDLLRRLFNTRVMHFVEDYIRAACEPYIGKANSLTNRNSLQTAITSKLNSLVDSLIRKYEFKVVDDGTADQYTYIDINYTIVPMNEIREIRNRIRVTN